MPSVFYMYNIEHVYVHEFNLFKCEDSAQYNSTVYDIIYYMEIYLMLHILTANSKKE